MIAGTVITLFGGLMVTFCALWLAARRERDEANRLGEYWHKHWEDRMAEYEKLSARVASAQKALKG